MPVEPDGDEVRVQSRLLAARAQARHPALDLWRFVADSDVLPEPKTMKLSDEDESVLEAERENAELLRAALLVAATDIVDWCTDDIETVEFSMASRPTMTQQRIRSFTAGSRGDHRRAYDEEFFRKVLVIAVQVAAELADPHGGPASCTAEEIVRHAADSIAGDLCEAAGLVKPWLDPDESLLEDTDFDFLYATSMDGLEDDPGTQAALGIDVPPVRD